jgi:hypothetical protein
MKNIVIHVCYYYQRLHFKYQVFIVSKRYIKKFLDELNNEKNI